MFLSQIKKINLAFNIKIFIIFSENTEMTLIWTTTLPIQLIKIFQTIALHPLSFFPSDGVR